MPYTGPTNPHPGVAARTPGPLRPALGAAVALTLLATGCASNATPSEVEAQTQEYDGNFAIELLKMREPEGGSTAIQEINADITETLGSVTSIAEIQEQVPQGQWLQVRSYPFTSEDYVQIVTTGASLPGLEELEVEAWVYDRTADRWVTEEDVADSIEFDEDAALQSIAAATNPQVNPDDLYIDDTVFYYAKDKDTLALRVIAVVDIDSEDGTRQGLYSIIPSTGAATALDPNQAFAPGDIDALDPPLFGSRK
ncbi:MAG: hypothetical protein LBJ08_00795 [Bifidobacteriaceae bacterium]|jgi:hypothetical protein|nr:hypothetical protein [Bifidobacteriaceae bacterium]